MKRFDLVKGHVEIRNYKDIVKGCTLDVDLAKGGIDVETIKSFDTKEEALEELKKYKTSVYSFSSTVGTMWEITEYFVEEGDYNEEGELTGCVDVWEYSEMPILNEYGVVIDFEVAATLMDKELTEEINLDIDLDRCTNQEYFNEYAKRHKEKFGEVWELATSNPCY